jgi:hypothetical protein
VTGIPTVTVIKKWKHRITMKSKLFNEDSPMVRSVVAKILADSTLTNDERVIWLYLFDHRDSNVPVGGNLPVSGVRLHPMGTEQEARKAINSLIRKGRAIEIHPASFTAPDGIYQLSVTGIL